MIRKRSRNERGVTREPWLESFHSFAFGYYDDPAWRHWGALRVINEDRVAPGQGFGLHPHRDMEILTWVLSGKLEHRDSLDHQSVISAGEIQRMTAGHGIWHSEFNASSQEPVHLLQIWIRPETLRLPPSYQQQRLKGHRPLELLASNELGKGLKIHQEARVYRVDLEAGETLELPRVPGHLGWLQIVAGAGRLEDVNLEAGDGAGIKSGHMGPLRLEASAAIRGLWFDLTGV